MLSVQTRGPRWQQRERLMLPVVGKQTEPRTRPGLNQKKRQGDGLTVMSGKMRGVARNPDPLRVMENSERT